MPQQTTWKIWDYKKPRRIPKTHENILSILFSDFANRLTTRLSNLWQNTVQVSVEEVFQSPYNRYQISIPHPTFIATFELCPFNQYAIFEVNPPILYRAIHHMLGTEGKSGSLGHQWHDLETGLTRKFMNLLLRELNHAWEPLFSPVTFSIRELQTSLAHINVIPQGEICLVLVLKVHTEEGEGLITFAFPNCSISYLGQELEKLHASLYSPEVISTNHYPSHVNIHDIQFNLKAVLGKVEIDQGDFKSLQVGDILELGQQTVEPICLLVEDEETFHVMPGLINRSKGVQIKSVIEKGAREI